MNPLDQSRQTAVRFKRVLVGATVQDSILDICEAVSGCNLIERLGRLQMDAAPGYPVKQGHPRRQRSIEVSLASRRNRSGSIVGFHPDQNADGITREELPNAGA